MGLFSSGPLSNQALGIMPGDQPDYSRMEMPAFPKAGERRGGLLGFLGGGLGKSLLGGVLDGVATHYGAQPGFSNARAQQQQMDLWNKKRQAEADDALRLAQEKAKLDRPAVAVNRDYLNSVRPGLGDQYISNYGDPLVATSLPNNRFYSGPRSGLDAALGGPPASPASDWTSAFSPEELTVMRREAERRQGGRPMGSPLQGAPNTKVVGGKQYWNIGGKWYDNPEGR